MSLCLTAAEIFELTHKQRASAQMRALKALGIDCQRRADNTVLVYRVAVERAAGVKLAKRKEIKANLKAANF